MKKEELTKLAESFLEEAFHANCYYNITKQYAENIRVYHEEMSLSGAFYTYTYNALVVAVFMELAKIYDSHSQSINIRKLMDICKENMLFFPRPRQLKMIIEGKEIIQNSPYKHPISPEEEEYFQEEIEGQKLLHELIGATEAQAYAEMTLERYFDLFEWKYERIKAKIDNLLKQRNKIYAHNDEKSIFKMEEVISNSPLNASDIESLISFALEFCQFVIALLTGVRKALKPVNINDWKGALNLVRLGYKYKDIEIEQDVEEFTKKHFPETEQMLERN